MVETLRCPTCLGVLLEHSATRCPTCHSRLRRRGGRPIVLGETSRLDLQATLPIERQSRRRLGRGYWNTEEPAPIGEHRSRHRDLDLDLNVDPEPGAVPLVPEYGPVPCAWFDAQAEPEIESVQLFEPVAAPTGNRRRLRLASERRGRVDN